VREITRIDSTRSALVTVCIGFIRTFGDAALFCRNRDKVALIQFKVRLARYALRRRTWVNVLLPADFIKFAEAPRFVRILSVIGPFPPLVPVREYFGAFEANNRKKESGTSRWSESVRLTVEWLKFTRDFRRG
jgi:hypothetical protein